MVGVTNQKTKGKEAKEMEEKEQETGIDFLVIFLRKKNVYFKHALSKENRDLMYNYIKHSISLFI